MKKSSNIGDIFSVKIDNSIKKYFHHVENDITQLNSNIVRVFCETYSVDEHPNLTEVINGKIDFYAHCITKLGVKLGFWEKAGNIPNTKKINVLFRSSSDYGNLNIAISYDWWIWKINEQQINVGSLIGENRKAEIGVVVPPDSMVHRMKEGVYDFVYPGFL